MSTVRNIERRMFIRRQADRDVQTGGAAAAAPRAREWGVEWNGIWTGYMVWAGVEAILLFLVLGIGFSSLNPLRASSWAGVGRGVVIWIAIMTFIATFIGSWVAGRTPPATKHHGIAKGITLWGMIVITTVLLVGWIAGQAVQVASGAVSGVASAAPTAATTGISTLQGALQSHGINLSRAQTTDIATRMAAGDRTGAASTLSRDAGISNAQANDILSSVQSGPVGALGGAASQAGTAAGRAVKQGGGSMAWGLFWISLITLGCAIGGGATGGGGLKRVRPQPAPAS